MARFYVGDEVSSGLTVVLPSVGSGSVAQLAIDVLLHNMSDASLVGRIRHNALVPMAGAGPGGIGVVTAAEVYMSKEAKILIIQQRTPLVRERRAGFRAALVEWLASIGSARVVVLAGADAAERVEAQLMGTQLRCVLTAELESEAEALAAVQCPILERRLPTAANPDGVYIHGGGIARKLLAACADRKLPAAVMLHFVPPGDTRPAALALAGAAARWLQTNDPAEWKAPPVWAMVYGTDKPTPGLF